jgi:hypothetical protein
MLSDCVVDMTDDSCSCESLGESQVDMSHRFSQHRCCDFAVPGPFQHSVNTSPSHGPCSPQSSFEYSVLQFDFSLGSGPIDTAVISAISSGSAGSDEYSYFEERFHLIPQCMREDIAVSQQDCLELQLRSSCANALSICAFSEESNTR